MKKLLILFFFIILSLKVSCQSTSKWKHIHHNKRLEILDSNKTIKGQVIKITFEPDGDYHIQLKLDSTNNYLLNKNNIKHQNNCLVVEIICMKKIRWPFFCACRGYKNNIEIPKINDYVEVSGVFVYDKIHKWNEIHPVNSLKIKN